MRQFLVIITVLCSTMCMVMTTWNYGYSVGNSGASYTVIKPAFSGVRPEYEIVKPSHSALRAGLSVFKPNYNGIKPHYTPDYISKPSYSGLRAGMKPTYLADRHERHYKYDRKANPRKYESTVNKLNSKTRQMKNSRIFVKRLDSHNGKVESVYEIDSFDNIIR